MTIATGVDIFAFYTQPSEPLALALALLFNRHGWDTESINRLRDGQYRICMRKGTL